MKIKNSLFLLLGTFFIFACNNQPAEKRIKELEVTDSIVTSVVEPDIIQSENTIEAKFIEFVLGDKAHFIFEDKNGNRIDFEDCVETDYKFAVELNANQSNATNQGWGANSALIGKWFLLEFQNKNVPAYEDGPMVESKRIVAVKKLD